MQNQQSNLKAGLWMAAWLALMLGMTVASREVTREIDVLQLMELRSVIGFVMLLPLVFASGGFAAMRTQRPAQHIGRNIAHYTGQALWLYALTLIPLAHLISIEFTSPLWTALLAVAFLGERLNARKIAAHRARPGRCRRHRAARRDQRWIPAIWWCWRRPSPSASRSPWSSR